MKTEGSGLSLHLTSSSTASHMPVLEKKKIKNLTRKKITFTSLDRPSLIAFTLQDLFEFRTRWPSAIDTRHRSLQYRGLKKVLQDKTIFSGLSDDESVIFSQIRICISLS